MDRGPVSDHGVSSGLSTIHSPLSTHRLKHVSHTTVPTAPGIKR